MTIVHYFKIIHARHLFIFELIYYVHCFYSLQLVHPTYQALLGHLRTKFLEKFKNDMEDALKSRKGFASSVRECSQTSILEFDQGCAGILLKL